MGVTRSGDQKSIKMRHWKKSLMVYIRQYGDLSFNITNFYQTFMNFIFTPPFKSYHT